MCLIKKIAVVYEEVPFLQGSCPVQHHIDGGSPANPPNGDGQEVEIQRSRISQPLHMEPPSFRPGVNCTFRPPFH